MTSSNLGDVGVALIKWWCIISVGTSCMHAGIGLMLDHRLIVDKALIQQWTNAMVVSSSCVKHVSKSCSSALLQYCAIETGREKKIPFHFPFIFLTCLPQIPQLGIFVKQFSLIFPLFPRCGGNLFPHQGILFPHWGNTIPQFSINSPRISPDSPVSSAVFNTTSQVYFLSDH